MSTCVSFALKNSVEKRSDISKNYHKFQNEKALFFLRPECYFGVEKHSEARKRTQNIRLDRSIYLVFLLILKRRTVPPKGFVALRHP